MRPVKFFIVMISAVIFSVSIMGVNVFASNSPGVPAGMLLNSTNGLTLMGINISSDIPKEDIDDFYNLISGLLSKLGGGELLSSYSPATLEGIGFTGDSLHSWAKGNLSVFKNYFQINVINIVSPVTGYRIEIYMWDNSENMAGTYITSIELPKQLPLFELLSIMNEGTHYMKINTTTTEISEDEEYAKMSFYYQQSSGSSEFYIGCIEVTPTLMKTIMMSLMK